MIGNVGFNGGGYNLGQYSGDVENIAKYTLGTTLVAQQENPFDGMLPMIGITGLMGIPAAYKILKQYRTNGGIIKNLKETEFRTFKDILDKLKTNVTNGNWKNLDTYKSMWRKHSLNVLEEAIPTGDKFNALGSKTQKFYNAVSTEIEKARNPVATPEEVAKYLKKANKKLSIANLQAYKETKPVSIAEAKGFGGKASAFFGKIGEFLHLPKLSGAVKGLAVKSPIVSNILKFGKGNGIFAAITGGIALFTQVIPAFGLGADKGMAQLGKSTVKTAASVGGWAAGAAVGAAIGSVIPGAGTLVGGAIGSIIGIIGGCLGSWAADKVAEGIVGKDELELAKDEQADKMTKEVQKDPQAVLQLLAAAQERLKSDDPNSEDAKIARQSIEQLTKLAQAQLQQNTGNSAQYNPNMNLMA